MKEIVFKHYANDERIYTGCYLTVDNEKVFVVAWRSDNGKRIDCVTYSEKNAVMSFERGDWIKI